MDRDDLLDQVKLDVMMCFAVYSTEHAISRFYRPALDALGLTYPQFVVMMALWETGDTTMRALSEKVGLDSSTLTPLLKKLEAAGLVTRSRNKADERVLDVGLTEKGLGLRRQGCSAGLALAENSGESIESMLELLERLRKIRENLSAAADGA